MSTPTSNLRWQRRSYDVGFYVNPYEGIGGFRFRLNDFDFKGTGVPFVPYTPTNWMERPPTRIDPSDQSPPPMIRSLPNSEAPA